MRRFSLLALAALLSALPAAPARSGTAEVEAGRREAAATRDRLAREEDRLRGELASVDADVKRLAGRAASTAKSLEATRGERESLEKSLAELRKFFLDHRVRIRKRAAAVYRRSDVSTLGAGLVREDPVAAFDHLHYGARVVAADAAFLRELSSKLAEAKAKAGALAAREAEEKELAATLARDRAALARESERLARLLADLHQAMRALETRLAGYGEAATSVDREVATIREDPTPRGAEPPAPPPERPAPDPGGDGGRRPAADAAPAGGRINFAWPFPGRKPEILSLFGRQTDPVFNIEFTNSGVDIRAAERDAVAAAAPGVVRYRGRMKGFGHVVMIEHSPELLTLYSRLGEISVGLGARVSAGEPVGTVGASEREGSSPFLHFEIRRNGESVDPMDFF